MITCWTTKTTFLSSSRRLTTRVLIVQSALCLFSNLFEFLFKSLKQSLSNFSWEIGEEVRRKHFSLGVVPVTGCCLT